MTPELPQIAVCVGHHQNAKGAWSKDETAEWDYNRKVAALVSQALGPSAETYLRNPNVGYSEAMRQLGVEINRRQPDCKLALELHFNAYNGAAQGIEHLYVSTAGERYARTFVEVQAERFPDEVLRRDGGVLKAERGMNGYGFLVAVRPPAVLLEPFFGDHASSWQRYRAPGVLADIYVDAIRRAFI